jgi:penicillin amidase
MHLGLDVPPVWYRARLRAAGLPEQNGVTLPGVPALVAGSNGHIAWGFTNSYGDWVDLRRVSCAADGRAWQAAEGPRPFTTHQEHLAVRGADPLVLTVREAGADVLYAQDKARNECTLASWVALQPGGFNVELRRLGQALSVSEALAIAPTAGIPQQNLVVGDREGHLAWTIAGRVPQGEHPVIVDPAAGAVWTANARAVSGDAERAIGGDEWQWGAGYDLGARAAQIRRGLEELKRPAKPADMLRIQLDDKALYLERWRGVLLAALDEEAVRNRPARAEMRALVEQWDARADVDSVGYRLVRRFQRELGDAAWRMLLGAIGLDEAQHRRPRRFDATLWRLVSEQPPHLLSGDYGDWRAFTLAQVDRTLVELARSCPQLARCRWGNVNRAEVRHALSRAVPGLAWLLDRPDRGLPGDTDMPRVQAPGFGASERFAVSPGQEAYGYLHVAGGQSGHPLSPYYSAGYEDWLEGLPSPFLPGPPQHTVSFSPGTP